MDRDERRRLADANVVARFDLTRERVADPRGGTARFGAVEVVAIGVDAPYFNGVFAGDRATTPRDVTAAVAWVDARGLPVSVRLHEDAGPDLRAAVEDMGLVAHPLLLPVMALEPLRPPPPPPPELAIRTGGVEL
ncbi:MAG TPA: hypothetical protein VFY18_03085, partial [Candidatus Limnocylindrales bacterium]|nr:hypothetical protein [Candidatus Limnocylindrales bacterium]